MSARWHPSDLKQKGTATATPRPRPVDSPAAPDAGRGGAEIAKRELSALPTPTAGTYPGPCTWLLAGGTISASLPRPLDAGRLRLVLVLPADAAAVARVLAALQGHSKTV